jgi:hypothetical protein
MGFRGWRIGTTSIAGALLLAMAAALPAGAATTPTPTPSPSASASTAPSSPSLSLPGFDPQKAIVQTLAEMLYGIDQEIVSQMQNVWTQMVAGSDNIEGQENVGVLVDNTKLRTLWGVSLAIATGSVLVLLLTIMAIYWMLGEFSGGVGHALGRNLVTFLFFVMLMSASYFLIARLIDVDNGLVNAINQQVVIELKNLPAFQGSMLPDPNTLNNTQDIIKWLALGLIMVIVAIELVILFVAYFIRIVLIWVLVAGAPFVLALGILPPARGIVIYWLKLLLATIFWKFANVLVFAVLVTMGAVSTVPIYNVLLVAAMLFFMILVPSTLMRALGEPSGAVVAIRQTAHAQAVRRPMALVGGRVSGWWRGRAA